MTSELGEMAKRCEYSGKICQVETILENISPSSVKKFRKNYCYGNKESCEQYKAIKDVQESGLEKEIKKAESDMFKALGKVLALYLLRKTRS
jgi:hypothetical protein